MTHEHRWEQVGSIGNMVACPICGEVGWWFPAQDESESRAS